MSSKFTQAEIRHRGMWKQDIQAALRGQMNDLVSHVECGVAELISKEVTKQLRPYLEVHERSQQQVRELVSNRDKTVKSDHEDFTKRIEDAVAEIVLKIFREYWVLDSEATFWAQTSAPFGLSLGLNRRLGNPIGLRKENEMLEPNAVIEPLSEQECERIYYEIRRYLGGAAQENLTRLYITQRELRRQGDRQREETSNRCGR
jgi:hypothetical protein